MITAVDSDGGDSERNVPFECNGNITLSSCKFSALDASGVRFASNATLQLEGSSFSGNLTLHDIAPATATSEAGGTTGSSVAPTIHLNDAKCEANASIRGCQIAWLMAPGLVVANSLAVQALKSSSGLILTGVSIGQHVKLLESTIEGPLHLDGSEIGGDLHIGQAPAMPMQLHGAPWAVVADGLKVGGNAQLAFNSSGRSSFSSMSVEGGLQIQSLRLHGLPGSMPALDLKLSRLNGGLVIKDIGTAHSLPGTSFSSVRAKQLSFYPGWRLVEALITTRDIGDPGIAAFLWNGADDVLALPGISPPIHEFNSEGWLKLSAATASAYLTFFCHHVWGEEGAFHIVTSTEVLKKRGIAPEPHKDRLRLVTRHEGDAFRIEAIVDYAGALFVSDFRVLPSGMVEMVADDAIAEQSATREQRYRPPLRQSTTPQSRVSPMPPLPSSSIQWPLPAAMPGEWRVLDAHDAGRFLAAYNTANTSRWWAELDLRGVRTPYIEDELLKDRSAPTAKGGSNGPTHRPVRLNLGGLRFEQVLSEPKRGLFARGQAHLEIGNAVAKTSVSRQ